VVVNRFGIGRFFVLAYEFINGFHDTANAVATVIYTKAMPARMAVVASGLFNFAGVMMGGWGWPMPLSTCCPSICCLAWTLPRV
jgi:hypothetical protein